MLRRKIWSGLLSGYGTRAFIGLLIVEFLSDPIFRADVGDYR
jgi:hypothetical protein